MTFDADRAAASFNIKALTELLHGGPDLNKIREEELLRVSRDSLLLNPLPWDVTRAAAREKCSSQIRRYVEIIDSLKGDEKRIYELSRVMNSYDQSFGMRIYVHYQLFRETISTQGTDEQFAKWKDDIDNTRVIGCFAMTELGHSSFLRGLETTATYDPKTQHFVVTSPTLTATKWWIGMAGRTASHTAALCQLVVNGKQHGLYWFIVPLRDIRTGRLMPGVNAGDIGHKSGRNGLDNGYIQFSAARVPRENMLARWASVSPEGEFKSFATGDMAAIAYNTLVTERFVAVVGIFDHIAPAITISVRYGMARRQSAKDDRIMDFQSHQYSLPVLAGTYITALVAPKLLTTWRGVLETTGNPTQFMKLIPEYHAISAALKAWVGYWCADSLEKCRRSMGGHAYNSLSTIPSLIADFGVYTTGGGDNIVLAQQHARWLLNVKRGNSMSTSFLDAVKPFSEASGSTDLTSSETHISIFQNVTAILVNKAKQDLAASIQSGKAIEEAWNDNMVDLITCSRIHAYSLWLQHGLKLISEIQSQDSQKILRKLLILFGLSLIEKEAAVLLEHGYLEQSQVKDVRQELLKYCKDVRGDCIPLVDAFDFPDWFLRSPLGCYDGNIYPKYFEAVKEANRQMDRMHPPNWQREMLPIYKSRL